VLFTILKKSDVVEDNTTFRIDAEYFKIEYLDAIEKIKACRFSCIDELTSWVTQGPNPSFSDNGIPYWPRQLSVNWGYGFVIPDANQS
jgi:hypothetical protein